MGSKFAEHSISPDFRYKVAQILQPIHLYHFPTISGFPTVSFDLDGLKCPLDVCSLTPGGHSGWVLKGLGVLARFLTFRGGHCDGHWQPLPGIPAPALLPSAQLIHFPGWCLAPESVWVCECPGAI